MGVIDDKRLNEMIAGMKLYADMPYGIKINEFSAKDLYSAMVELRELRGSADLQSKMEADLGRASLKTRGTVCKSSDFDDGYCKEHCTNYDFCAKRGELLNLQQKGTQDVVW